MDDRPDTLRGRTFRSLLAADGTPGPIEERVGRRLIRLLDPESVEGRSLIESTRVELIAPGGERLGNDPAAALDRLRRRLEERLADPDRAQEASAMREGLERLRRRSSRLRRSSGGSTRTTP